MKAIVFGATGRVGRPLYQYLLEQGWSVYGTSHATPMRDCIPFQLEKDDPGRLLRACEGIDVGFICAAVASIDACKKDPEQARAVNVDGTMRVARCLERAGARAVFFSSDYVFSGCAGGYGEDDEPDPVTEYGRQKLEVERMLGAVQGSLVLRLSRVVSSDMSAPGMLSDWVAAIRKGETVHCVSDQWFCPTDVEDVVRVAALLVERKAQGLYNVCQPRKYRRLELLGELVDTCGLSGVRVVERPTSTFGFPDLRGRDNSMKAMRLLKDTGYVCSKVARCLEKVAVQLGRAA